MVKYIDVFLCLKKSVIYAVSMPYGTLFMKREAMQIYSNRKFSGYDGVWVGVGEEERRFKKRTKRNFRGKGNVHHLYCGNGFTHASVCQNIKMYTLTTGSSMYTFIS